MPCTPNDYQAALDSQSASNPVALVNFLHRVMPRIQEDTDGYESFASHPIFLLVITQLCHLAGGDFRCPDYSWHFDTCEQRAGLAERV